jgi:hypothetical protein
MHVRVAYGHHVQELSLKVQMEQNYVSRNAQQARSIKEGSEKILALERTLQSFVEDFEKERAFMRQQWEHASAEMNSEVAGYKKLVEVRLCCAVLCACVMRCALCARCVMRCALCACTVHCVLCESAPCSHRAHIVLCSLHFLHKCSELVLWVYVT